MKQLTVIALLLFAMGCFAQTEEPKIVFEKDGYQYSEIGKACYDGDSLRVKELIAQGANPREAKTEGTLWFDLIHVAISQDNYEMLEYLVCDLKQDVNVIYDEVYRTPVSLAVFCEDKKTAYKMVKLLLDKGAYPDGCENKRDGKGYWQTDDLGKLLSSVIYHPLISAVLAENLEVAQLLVDRGADIADPCLQKNMKEWASDSQRETVKQFISKNTKKQ